MKKLLIIFMFVGMASYMCYSQEGLETSEPSEGGEQGPAEHEPINQPISGPHEGPEGLSPIAPDAHTYQEWKQTFDTFTQQGSGGVFGFFKREAGPLFQADPATRAEILSQEALNIPQQFTDKPIDSLTALIDILKLAQKPLLNLNQLQIQTVVSAITNSLANIISQSPLVDATIASNIAIKSNEPFAVLGKLAELSESLRLNDLIDQTHWQQIKKAFSSRIFSLLTQPDVNLDNFFQYRNALEASFPENDYWEQLLSEVTNTVQATLFSRGNFSSMENLIASFGSLRRYGPENAAALNTGISKYMQSLKTTPSEQIATAISLISNLQAMQKELTISQPITNSELKSYITTIIDTLTTSLKQQINSMAIEKASTERQSTLQNFSPKTFTLLKSLSESMPTTQDYSDLKAKIDEVGTYNEILNALAIKDTATFAQNLQQIDTLRNSLTTIDPADLQEAFADILSSMESIINYSTLNESTLNDIRGIIKQTQGWKNAVDAALIFKTKFSTNFEFEDAASIHGNLAATIEALDYRNFTKFDDTLYMMQEQYDALGFVAQQVKAITITTETGTYNLLDLSDFLRTIALAPQDLPPQEDTVSWSKLNALQKAGLLDDNYQVVQQGIFMVDISLWLSRTNQLNKFLTTNSSAPEPFQQLSPLQITAFAQATGDLPFKQASPQSMVPTTPSLLGQRFNLANMIPDDQIATLSSLLLNATNDPVVRALNGIRTAAGNTTVNLPETAGLGIDYGLVNNIRDALITIKATYTENLPPSGLDLLEKNIDNILSQQNPKTVPAEQIIDREYAGNVVRAQLGDPSSLAKLNVSTLGQKILSFLDQIGNLFNAAGKRIEFIMNMGITNVQFNTARFTEFMAKVAPPFAAWLAKLIAPKAAGIAVAAATGGNVPLGMVASKVIESTGIDTAVGLVAGATTCVGGFMLANVIRPQPEDIISINQELKSLNWDEYEMPSSLKQSSMNIVKKFADKESEKWVADINNKIAITEASEQYFLKQKAAYYGLLGLEPSATEAEFNRALINKNIELQNQFSATRALMARELLNAFNKYSVAANDMIDSHLKLSSSMVSIGIKANASSSFLIDVSAWAKRGAATGAIAGTALGLISGAASAPWGGLFSYVSAGVGAITGLIKGSVIGGGAGAIIGAATNIARRFFNEPSPADNISNQELISFMFDTYRQQKANLLAMQEYLTNSNNPNIQKINLISGDNFSKTMNSMLNDRLEWNKQIFETGINALLSKGSYGVTVKTSTTPSPEVVTK